MKTRLPPPDTCGYTTCRWPGPTSDSSHRAQFVSTVIFFPDERDNHQTMINADDERHGTATRPWAEKRLSAERLPPTSGSTAGTSPAPRALRVEHFARPSPHAGHLPLRGGAPQCAQRRDGVALGWDVGSCLGRDHIRARKIASSAFSTPTSDGSHATSTKASRMSPWAPHLTMANSLSAE